MIIYSILSGDYQASDAFMPHHKVFREIIDKRIGGKDYGVSLKKILIQYHLEGEHWKLHEKPIKLGNYMPTEQSIGAVVGVPKVFGSWPENEKRSFITSTTTQVVELVKERMDRKGITDIDFDRLMADLEACTQEYLRLPPIDVTDYLVVARELMKDGKYQQAYALMTEQMEKEPKSVPRYIVERAYCLLGLNQPVAALLDFKKGIALHEKNRVSHQDDAVGYIGAGIAFWWMNDYSEAIASWKRALPGRDKLVYGEVEALAFLFFAATMRDDSVLENEVVALMRRKWKKENRDIWPGPIVGMLLGEINRATFLNFGQKLGLLSSEESRLTKIHFWMGLVDYRKGNIKEYRIHLQQALDGNILQPEYYLAKYELSR